mgnify:CR=1 FL=1
MFGNNDESNPEDECCKAALPARQRHLNENSHYPFVASGMLSRLLGSSFPSASILDTRQGMVKPFVRIFEIRMRRQARDRV